MIAPKPLSAPSVLGWWVKLSLQREVPFVAESRLEYIATTGEEGEGDFG